MSDLHARLLTRCDELRGGLQAHDDNPAAVSANLRRSLGQSLAALRAVVELHAPVFFGGHWACLACSPGMPPPVLVLAEDCSTIQTIARELGVTTEGAPDA